MIIHAMLSLALAAQLVAQPSVSIRDVTGGLPFYLAAIEADRAVPGKELLVYLPSAWVVSVGRWHPTRHGVGGTRPGAGLCVEPWTWVASYGSVWHYTVVLDGTGDGVDEFLVYLEDGTVIPYVSAGLQSCR